MIEITWSYDKNWREVAECVVGSTPYMATSKHAAVFDLCRVLVTAGVPDQAATVTRKSDGFKLMPVNSIARAALMDAVESSTQVCRVVPYQPPPDYASFSPHAMTE